MAKKLIQAGLVQVGDRVKWFGGWHVVQSVAKVQIRGMQLAFTLNNQSIQIPLDDVNSVQITAGGHAITLGQTDQLECEPQRKGRG